ncbi:MAG: hypothetical protein AAGA30_18585 [Planctomycetota bacterium]
MDPEAIFVLMLDSFAEGEFDIASDSAQALVNWLRNGGFPPAVHVTCGSELFAPTHAAANRSIAFAVANEILARANSALAGP